MEIINDEKNNSTEEKLPLSRSVYNFLGGAMVLIGLVWLGDNYGLVSPRLMDALLSWQMLMVAVGVWLLCTKNHISGGVLTLLGELLVVTDYLNIHISFERLVLPLLLVGAGVATILLKGLKK